MRRARRAHPSRRQDGAMIKFLDAGPPARPARRGGAAGARGLKLCRACLLYCDLIQFRREYGPPMIRDCCRGTPTHCGRRERDFHVTVRSELSPGTGPRPARRAGPGPRRRRAGTQGRRDSL
eukprot:762701-Hanusia_phi.AAC.1